MSPRTPSVTCVILLGVLLASCAPSAAPAATPKEAPRPATPAVAPIDASAKPASPAATPKAAAQDPKYGGTLYISHSVDPRTYDPIQETSLDTFSLVAPSYSGIVQHDPLEPTKVIGDLAEKWEMSPDGLSYTFQLHKDVKWHDGAPFTSEDARFTLEIVRKPPTGVMSPRQEWLRAVDKIEAPEKDTLKMTLRYPSASFVHNLSDGRMLIIPKRIFEARGDMKRDIIGTGPYRFLSFAGGATFSVAKNPNYFIKGRPYLDGITWYIIPDVATRYAAIRTGRVQATPAGAQGLTPSQAEVIMKEMADKVNVYKYLSMNFLAFWMPFGRAPWNDVRLRRAVDLTIDRPNVVRLAMEGVAYVGSFMPPGNWGLPEAELANMPGYRQPKDADIAEAKKLMAEAGYARGIKTSVLTRRAHPIDKAAEILKVQLAQINIDVALSMQEVTTFNELTVKRTFDTLVRPANAAYDDPTAAFGMSFVTGVPLNYSDFSDERLDRWQDEQDRALDPAKRKQIVLDMQRRLHELVPSSILFWYGSQLGVWKQVQDLKPGIGLYSNLKFQNVWLAK
ncbi:MAG: ABC transporter substrate-binding protein [Chloroflexi bacterium]|nr:ABC transporter substrate-binding protein [Chloroflexota bacterium]